MLLHTDAPWILLGALALDALIGDPAALWRRLPHPVAAIGVAIGWLDRRLNRETWSAATRRRAGVAALAILVGAGFASGFLVESLLRRLPASEWFVALAASVFLAQRSLYDHVARVRDAFAVGGLAAARAAVSMIVGRDPDSLDEAGVCRAAIESCAENFSDGVVAPAFWFALLGLPGLIAYKTVNTADSMIGHRTPRHEAFGWAAARFDDVLNVCPARLAGVLVALAGPVSGGHPLQALTTMWRDARKYRSPNAGWPESAMAAALALALAGPRRYGTRRVDDPFLNPEGRPTATPGDITRALRVFVAAGVLHAGLYAALALIL
jgi:adenosylcobinamide-phosphate synthase